MATGTPEGFDVKRLIEEVTTTYARVAVDPDGEFHFHRGPEYAAEWLRYDINELRELPDEATSPFAGIANPLAIDTLQAGQSVLDVGCGAGMDLQLAAKRVGPSGKAIGVDMTEAMVDRARNAARKAGLENVELRLGNALDLPAEDEEVDVVISNGVINLTPNKVKAFSEIYRVLKPTGRMLLGDIIVHNELSEETRGDVDLWAG
jgi:SAM-dependent methyltransferase